ncbi:MAG: hypothetical protein JXA11_02665 [Phycisphaerae bacterium]|nr:hypothetical protein [Phycisphaerae bacterium]
MIVSEGFIMDCVRVGHAFLDREEYLDALLRMLDSSPRLVEEIVFFTSQYHCAGREEDLTRVAEKIARVMPKLRAAGYRVGVNHLTTTGHHEENLEAMADANLRRQVGLDGKVCRGAPCPADPEVLEYVRRCYKILAALKADILWVDDDVRLGGHLPTRGCCLCESCIEDFSCRFGETFSHASLVAAFDDPDVNRRAAVRRAFMERNTDVIRNLLSRIEKTVHEISPQTELGFMTGDRFWEGYGFAQWAEALRGETNLPVRWRPGGGFYTDERPRDLYGKACDIGRQAAVLPEFVTVVQSEIENFPYQPLRKSARSNALEATAYLFSGCSGSAWNTLGQDPRRLEEHQPLHEYLKRFVSFWNDLKELLRDSQLTGVWPAWDGMQIAAGRAGQVDHFFNDVSRDMHQPYSPGDLGIPVCFHPNGAMVTVLSGVMPRALGKQRMEQLLAGGVLLDAEAAETLHEMGLGELTGVSLGATYEQDTVERITDHPLNGPMTGTIRDCRQSFTFWTIPARELIPADETVAVLSRLQDYQGRDRGASTTLHKNQLGGRVAVMSYYPWTLNQGSEKRYQIQAICDALSDNHMPLTIHTMARIASWVRRRKSGEFVIGLMNWSSDTYEQVDISIRSNAKTFKKISMDNRREFLPTQPGERGMRVTLRNFKPFTFEVILAGG